MLLSGVQKKKKPKKHYSHSYTSIILKCKVTEVKLQFHQYSLFCLEQDRLTITIQNVTLTLYVGPHKALSVNNGSSVFLE